LSPKHHFRFSDGVINPVRRRWIGVREDHTGEGEPANAIVAIDFDQPGTSPGRMHVGGQDFFCDHRGQAYLRLIGDSLNPLADALPRSQTWCYFADRRGSGRSARLLTEARAERDGSGKEDECLPEPRIFSSNRSRDVRMSLT
jgi:hypothetical protein